VLELDTFKGHLALDVRSVIHAMNIDLVVAPGVLTSHLHIVVNKHFENHLKQLYCEWLLVGDQFLTPSCVSKGVQYRTAVQLGADLSRSNS
jgi:hypothetical protein